MVLDEMETPAGRLQLHAWRHDGVTWIGVWSGSEDIGAMAIGLGTGSRRRFIEASACILRGWGFAYGGVSGEIVRAAVRSDGGVLFPARIVPLPERLEGEYRAAWGVAERCRTTCELVGFDRRGRLVEPTAVRSRPAGPSTAR